MPEAIGTAMMIERLRGGKLMPFAEAINFELPNVGLRSTPKLAARDMKAAGYISMRSYLRDKNPVMALRDVYTNEPGFPCQSPFFKVNLLSI